jgi:hypothetical protein
MFLKHGIGMDPSEMVDYFIRRFTTTGSSASCTIGVRIFSGVLVAFSNPTAIKGRLSV